MLELTSWWISTASCGLTCWKFISPLSNCKKIKVSLTTTVKTLLWKAPIKVTALIKEDINFHHDGKLHLKLLIMISTKRTDIQCLWCFTDRVVHNWCRQILVDNIITSWPQACKHVKNLQLIEIMLGMLLRTITNFWGTILQSVCKGLQLRTALY